MTEEMEENLSEEELLTQQIPKVDIIVLGYGIQGRAILHYFLNYTDYKILTLDVESPEELPAKWHGRWVHLVDCWQYERWHHGVQEKYTVVISCLPTRWNLAVAESCRLVQANYIDLGGDIEVANELFDLSKDYVDLGLICVPDCGVAPGLVSSLAGTRHRQGMEHIRIFAGGIPLEPSFPQFGYVLAFSAEGVIKEYSGIAESRENGHEMIEPALEEGEKVWEFVPGLGVLEGLPTSGSLSIAPRTIQCIDLTYHTLRYAGHWDYVKKNIMTAANSEDILDAMSDELSPTNPDLLILGCKTKKNIKDEETTEWYRWDYDFENNIGAMAQITGYTVAAVTCMVLEKKIQAGVLDMAKLDFFELKEKISRAPNQFRIPQHDYPGKIT